MPYAVASADEINNPDTRAYTPHGNLCKLFTAQEPEVIVSGSAGTGKSIASLTKLFLCCGKYENIRALMVRKTRESITESALVTFENKVVPANHPILYGPRRNYRQSYFFPNGSQIVIGGMDKPVKIMSTDYDLVYVQEAIELDERDWELLTTRLRNGKMPYQQIFGDTNPDTPQHWLYRRVQDKVCRMIETSHEDNPELWDGTNWTPRGLEYLAKLDRLSGARKERLRWGKWVQAEGVVYDGWDRKIHLVEPYEVPAAWPRYWAIDFGFTNPFVCLFAAVDPDGRIHVYREVYMTSRLVEDHAKVIRNMAFSELPKDHDRSKGLGDLTPRAILCDHDAEGRATLERYLGIRTTPARKEPITEGIQCVQQRLRKAGDNKPRLFFFNNSLVERDKALWEDKLPVCTSEEFDSYIWAQSTNVTLGNKNVKEVPQDKDNHGMDALRYLVAHFDMKQRPSNSAPRPLTQGIRNISPLSMPRSNRIQDA